MTYDDDHVEKQYCPNGHELEYDVNTEEYDSFCVICDETIPPEDSECEYCGKPATCYVQDTPSCDDCQFEHYEKYIID